VLAEVPPDPPAMLRVYEPSVVVAVVETCSDVVFPVVEAGVKLTPALAGAPVTEKVIAPVKLVRVTVTVYAATVPAGALMLVGLTVSENFDGGAVTVRLAGTE
jgi:hypothetical protein